MRAFKILCFVCCCVCALLVVGVRAWAADEDQCPDPLTYPLTPAGAVEFYGDFYQWVAENPEQYVNLVVSGQDPYGRAKLVYDAAGVVVDDFPDIVDNFSDYFIPGSGASSTTEHAHSNGSVHDSRGGSYFVEYDGTRYQLFYQYPNGDKEMLAGLVTDSILTYDIDVTKLDDGFFDARVNYYDAGGLCWSNNKVWKPVYNDYDQGSTDLIDDSSGGGGGDYHLKDMSIDDYQQFIKDLSDWGLLASTTINNITNNTSNCNCKDYSDILNSILSQCKSINSNTNKIYDKTVSIDNTVSDIDDNTDEIEPLLRQIVENTKPEDKADVFSSFSSIYVTLYTKLDYDKFCILVDDVERLVYYGSQPQDIKFNLYGSDCVILSASDLSSFSDGIDLLKGVFSLLIFYVWVLKMRERVSSF